VIVLQTLQFPQALQTSQTLQTSHFHEDEAVAKLSKLLALECGMSPEKAEQIYIAALLHDAGKKKLSAELLNKPDKLTPEEFEVMKTHTTFGAEMLRCVEGDLGVMVRKVALYHHERWDSCGYWGKSLSKLPRYVEIVAIADTFTALVSPLRTYKQPWPPKEAIDYIHSQAGSHFSHAMVNIFLQLLRTNDRIAGIYEPLLVVPAIIVTPKNATQGGVRNSRRFRI